MHVNEEKCCDRGGTNRRERDMDVFFVKFKGVSHYTILGEFEIRVVGDTASGNLQNTTIFTIYKQCSLQMV